MKLSDLLFLTLVIVLAVSLASIWFYPSMQEFMEGNTMWNGIRDFSRESGASNIDSLEDLPDSPENVVLVAIPYKDYRPDELEELKQFLTTAAALIILMDDFGFGNQLLASLDMPVRFDHRVLLDPVFCYKNQYFPLITEFSPRSQRIRDYLPGVQSCLGPERRGQRGCLSLVIGHQFPGY